MRTAPFSGDAPSGDDAPAGLPSGTPPRAPGTDSARRAALLLSVPSVLLLVLVAVRWEPLTDLDSSVARTVHGWALADPGLTQLQRVLTDWVWDPWTMRALCAAAVLALLWRGAWRLGLWVAGVCAFGTLVQQGLKAAVGRDRPVWTDPVDSAHYAAFPSGHAMTATVVCGLLLWLLRLYGVGGRPLRRTARCLAVVSVLGVGLTRVWLGVHWLSDVWGGWLLGALTVSAAVGLCPRRVRAVSEKRAPA